METNADRLPIVVGVDGSNESLAALRRASELATALDAPLRAVTAWQLPVTYDASFSSGVYSPEDDARSILESSIDAVFGERLPQIETRLIAGPVASALIDESRGASMLVVGSRGRGGFAGLLLGSVSTACAQHAHCPVLVMHGARTKPAEPSRSQEEAVA